MQTVQLRRYVIVEGELDAFAEWWERIMPPLRARFGFTVAFAYSVPEQSEFVWAVSYPGSRAQFEEAEREYNASQARAAIFVDLPERVEQQIIAFADEITTGALTTSTTQEG